MHNSNHLQKNVDFRVSKKNYLCDHPSGDPGGFPGFPNSTSPGPASSPIGRSGLHTANQNGGDLYRYDNETG
jgi:hypothetical protein